MITEDFARKEIIRIGRRMYERGLVIATDGNLSMRLPRGLFVVTRSGISKGDLADRDLVICDGNGKTLRGGKVSSELLLHLAAYHLRPDINAVIHAHPPVAISFTLAGVPLDEAALPEVVMSLGSIPTTIFAAPASAEGAEVIRTAILSHDAILLDRHGSITVGKTLTEAFHKLEQLEFAATVTHKAMTLGEVRTLSETELAQVYAALERYKGTSTKTADHCPHCGKSIQDSHFSQRSGTPDRLAGADFNKLAPLIRKVIREGHM